MSQLPTTVAAINQLLDMFDEIIKSGDYPASLPKVRTSIITAAVMLDTTFATRLQNLDVLAAQRQSATSSNVVKFPIGMPPRTGGAPANVKKSNAAVVVGNAQPTIKQTPPVPTMTAAQINSVEHIPQPLIPIAKNMIKNSASDSGAMYHSGLAVIAAKFGVDISTQKTDTGKAAAIKAFLMQLPDAIKWAQDDSNDSQNENAMETALQTEELLLVAGKGITSDTPMEEITDSAIEQVIKRKTIKKVK